MAITQEFDLNLIPSSAPVVVHVDQYDHGTGRLVASLYNGDAPYSPSSASVYVQGTKPDGKFFVSSTGVSLSGNEVTADLTEVMTQASGQVRMQFVVTEQSGRTGTFVFFLQVQASALPNDSELSQSDFSMVEEAIEMIQESVSDAAESATEAAASASASTQKAEDAEAWAKGTRDGEPVESTDETYHNNAKYWADQAAASASHGGHTIEDENGTAMTARTYLQFENADVVDDPTNNRTVVTPRGGTGGSTIVVSTTETSLYNKNVTISDGTNTVTEQFSASGVATFAGVTLTGSLTISSTDGTSTARATLDVPYYGSYTKVLTFFNATIHVVGDKSIFVGKTVKAVKNGIVIATATFTSATSGAEADIQVGESGTYTVECQVEWRNVQSASLNVTSETTYNASLSCIATTCFLVTSDAAFANADIVVTLAGEPSATETIQFTNSEAIYVAVKAGTYTFTVTYQGVPYAVTQVIGDSAPITITLQRWSATLNITTASSTLYGQSISIYKGADLVGTTAFDNSGFASFTVHASGTYKAICTYDSYPFSTGDVVISQETTYSATITYFGATLAISTTSSDLYSQTITISKGGQTVGTTAFSAQGSASYTVHETGTYTLDCEGYTATQAVSAETTYNVTINSNNVTITTDATVLEGETLTATNGVDTETATITNGVAGFNLAAGEWEVAGIPITVVSGQTYTKKIVVFAYHYSETDSNPASGDYPSGYDNYGWTPLSMDLASTGAPTYNSWNPTGANADKLAWFFPKSCMVKYDGTVDYYLDEDDETKKSDGVTASDVANSSYAGNAMIEWGQDGRRIYWKIVADSGNNGWTFIVANAEVLGLKPWNHYDINGDSNMHWYEAKYYGSSDGTRLRSISGGTNYVNNAGTTEISIAEANNQTANKIWTTGVFCDYMFFALASVLITKNLNFQAALGAGRSASGNNSAIGQGTMNGKGRFYGKSNGTDGVKIFGVENPYGNLWRHIRGLININGSYRIKMTYDQTDGSTVDGYNTDGSGYINAGSIGTTATWVYPKHDIVRDNCLLAQTDGGSETTYYCDGTYLVASGTAYAMVGGDWSSGGFAGPFNVHLGSAVSAGTTRSGAALSLKPLAQ